MANDNFKIEFIGFIVCMSVIAFVLGIAEKIQNYLLDKMGIWLIVIVVIILGIVVYITNKH